MVSRPRRPRIGDQAGRRLLFVVGVLVCVAGARRLAGHIGELALVPPRVNQPKLPLNPKESYTETPEAGAASSATSGVERLLLRHCAWGYWEKLSCAEFANS